MRLPAPPSILREWRESDLSSLVQYANNRNIWLQLRDRLPHPYTEADGRAWIACTASEEPITNLAIEYEQQAVGGIGLVLQNDIETGTAEVGYWVGEPFWGKGIATAALRAFASWAFKELSLRRLFAGVMAGNHASRRVLEKVGFQDEGMHRQHIIKAGVVQDQAYYGLLPEDLIITSPQR